MGDTVDGQFNIGNAITGMAQMGQMGIQNALTRQQYTQNAIAIQNARAKQVANQLVATAINQQTGRFDPLLYNQNLANTPGAMYALLDASQAGENNQATALSNQQQQQQNAFNHFKWAGNLATAYSKNPPTVQQLRDDQIEGINGGLQTASDAAQVLSLAPTDLPPEQQKAVWANHALRLNAAAGQIGQSLPSLSSVSGPGGTVLVDTSPGSPTFTAPGTVITPGAAPTTTVVNPANPTQTMYLGNAPPAIVPPQGEMAPVPQLLPLGGVAPGALGSGTYSQSAPGGGSSPAAAAGGTAPAPSPANPLAGQLSTAPLGTGTLANALAQSSADLVSSASAAQPLLSSAQSILTNLKSVSPGFNGGAAAPDLMKLASTAASLGINVDGTGLADYQVFNKLVSQLANSAATGGAVDPSTDARLEAIANANPTSMMSPTARADAIATVQGALAAKSAYYNSALQYAQSQPGIPPTTMALNYARQWSKQFPDTTAFQFPYMTRPQQQKVYSSMSASERADLMSTANNAIAAGYFSKYQFINGGQ